MRHYYEVTGYCADASAWCIGCTIDTYGEPEDGGLEVVDREGNEVTPIFLGSEWDYQPHCDGCGDPIDCTVLDHHWI